MVPGIGDVDVAGGIRGQAHGFDELSRPDAGATPLEDPPALRVEPHDLLVSGVGDVDRSARDENRARTKETVLLSADRREEAIVGAHVDDALVPGIGDPEIALRIDGDAAGFVELAGTWALRPKLAQELTVRIEDLDAAVLGVGNIEVPAHPRPDPVARESLVLTRCFPKS